MPRPNVLVIAVDGLRASSLGSYGNTWYRTPALDKLAAQSVLCDWAFVDSTNLERIYRGLWQSVSALRADGFGNHAWSLPAALSQHGYHTRLVTDSREITEYSAAEHFSDAVLLPSDPAAEVHEIEQTCTAGVFAEVLEFLDDRSVDQPWFLWTHLNGLYGAWDAPHGLALSLVDEDDIPPEPSTTAPNLAVDRGAQAETIFAETCRYAAQVIALDALMAPIVELVESGAAGECLLVVLGTRGFPLGEHGRLGGVDERLYSEQLHVPLLMRLPMCQSGLARIPHLIEPCDVPATILRAIGANGDGSADGRDFTELLRHQPSPWRHCSLACEEEQTYSIRTPAWYLRGLDGDEKTDVELFVKPDDRWDANDVATRCPEVVEELSGAARANLALVVAGERLSLETLAPRLVEPNR